MTRIMLQKMKFKTGQATTKHNCVEDMKAMVNAPMLDARMLMVKRSLFSIDKNTIQIRREIITKIKIKWSKRLILSKLKSQKSNHINNQYGTNSLINRKRQSKISQDKNLRKLINFKKMIMHMIIMMSNMMKMKINIQTTGLIKIYTKRQFAIISKQTENVHTDLPVCLLTVRRNCAKLKSNRVRTNIST